MDESAADAMTTQQVVAAGDKIQDQTQESVNRMKQLVSCLPKIFLVIETGY